MFHSDSGNPLADYFSFSFAIRWLPMAGGELTADFPRVFPIQNCEAHPSPFGPFADEWASLLHSSHLYPPWSEIEIRFSRLSIHSALTRTTTNAFATLKFSLWPEGSNYPWRNTYQGTNLLIWELEYSFENGWNEISSCNTVRCIIFPINTHYQRSGLLLCLPKSGWKTVGLDSRGKSIAENAYGTLSGIWEGRWTWWRTKKGIPKMNLHNTVNIYVPKQEHEIWYL